MLVSGGSVWGVVGATVAILAALYLLWRHHPSYGANPGVPCFPVLGAMPLILLNKHRFYEWTCERFERAQALSVRFFIGPLGCISTADPQVVQHILKSRFEQYPKGHSFSSRFQDLLGSGIFSSDGPIWRFQRQVASYVFTSSSLRDFVIEIGSSEIKGRLLPAVDFACTSLAGRPIDLQALMMDFTFDTIAQLTFGTDPACLTKCHVVVSDVGADVQHEEVSVKADVVGDKGRVVHSKVCHGTLVQQENPYATAQGEHGCRTENLHEHHVTDLQEGPQRASRDGAAGTSCREVPDDVIQGFARGFQVAMDVVASRFLVPDFIWKTQRALRVGSEKKLYHALDGVNKFARIAIERSKHDLDGERKDLLSRFLRLSRSQVQSVLEGEDEVAWKGSDGEHGQALSDAFLRDILISFLFAGREAIVAGITFMVWQLCRHPRVEEAINEEIKGILRGRESNREGNAAEVDHINAGGTFSLEELRQMTYLHASLYESMRLHPPVPSNAKSAAEDDVLPNGLRICRGEQLSYNILAMGRAERIWGKDRLEFRPERWIGEDGQFVPPIAYRYPVFQAGPRVCLGKELALLEMKLVVASLVQNFEFKGIPGFEPRMTFKAVLSMTNGLPLIIKRRDPTRE